MKIFPISRGAHTNAFTRDTGNSYRASRASIAGESHLRRIAPKLISVETIRLATDEILYHAGRSYFLRSTFARAPASSSPEKTPPSLFMQISPAHSRFRFGAGRKSAVNSRGTLRKARAAVFYLTTANFIFAPGRREDRRAGGERRRVSETIGDSWRRLGWAATPDGYTPDILPDNGRSGSH